MRRRNALKKDAEAAAHDLEQKQRRRRMSEAQKRDAERVRGRYDMPAWLKDEVDAAAKRYETSSSQLAAVLLAWALRDLNDQHPGLVDAIVSNREQSKSLRFRYDLRIPSSLKGSAPYGAD